METPLDLGCHHLSNWCSGIGQLNRTFKKDQKLDLMHIAICKLLEPYGYYEFDFVDEEGWPHYKVKEHLPHLKGR